MKKQNVNPRKVFPEIENMIYDLSWRFAKTYPIKFEDARSIASMAFMKACADWKPDRVGPNGKPTKLTTWIYYWIWCELKTYVMKRTVEPLCFCDIKEEMVGEAPPLRAESLDLLCTMSQDAREIVALLLETPEEIMEGVHTVHKLVKRVKKTLVKKWENPVRFQQAFTEAQAKFQEAWQCP